MYTYTYIQKYTQTHIHEYKKVLIYCIIQQTVISSLPGRVYKGAQPEEGSLSVTGSFTYVGDDGQEYTVTYTADENGYHAEGAHLPTPPPIPSEILKSLQLTDRSRGMKMILKILFNFSPGLLFASSSFIE